MNASVPRDFIDTNPQANNLPQTQTSSNSKDAEFNKSLDELERRNKSLGKQMTQNLALGLKGVVADNKALKAFNTGRRIYQFATMWAPAILIFIGLSAILYVVTTVFNHPIDNLDIVFTCQLTGQGLNEGCFDILGEKVQTQLAPDEDETGGINNPNETL